ncbi:MAG: RsmD family RNA methyltransferase [Thermodesulfobacteriota bacterium]
MTTRTGDRPGVRITSGWLRGRRVETPAGEGTRPLLTRLRKTLADLLRPKLPGARVLDLFGGSGAISFELLSNGAASAAVCELDPVAAALVAANVQALGLEEKVRVLPGDALEWVARLGASGARFDVVVVAPPYGLGLQGRALAALGEHPVLAPGSTVVVQREAREPLAEPPGGLRLTRSRGHGRTVFDFYEPCG